MNRLKGHISKITTQESLSLVKVQLGDLELSAIVIDTPSSSDYLRLGNEVQVIFKETEVIIAKENNVPISLQNKIPGTIDSIETGDLLAKIIIRSAYGKITSVITKNAVEQLGLEKESPVLAMIKTNEMMLSV